MWLPHHLECDTQDCAHWCDECCSLPQPVKLLNHCCTDYKPRPVPTITIVINGGNLESVYASPDLPSISVEVVDWDNAKVSDPAEQQRLEQYMEEITKNHTKIQ